MTGSPRTSGDIASPGTTAKAPGITLVPSNQSVVAAWQARVLQLEAQLKERDGELAIAKTQLKELQTRLQAHLGHSLKRPLKRA